MNSFTIVHIAISVIGIASGAVVMVGLLDARRLDAWTAVFLASTVLTSATGYLFPFEHLLPSHIVGAISLAVLATAIVARYQRQLAGVWRQIYVVSAVVALYLNVFVLVVQAFRRVPALNAVAPTQSEPPFAIAQAIVLVAFVALGVAAVKHFRTAGVGAKPAMLA
jgi:hypothetical protein